SLVTLVRRRESAITDLNLSTEFSSGNTGKSDGETWKEKGRNAGSSGNQQSSTETSNARSSSSSSTSLTTTTSSSTSSTASSSGTTSLTTTSTRSSSVSPATRNNAQNSGGSSSSSSPAPTTNSSSTSGHQIGTMSAPPGRQVPKRRMRRRATSHSQDPAEQLTEMSVRGLNLFRYASISEGVYQCTECAKLDIQKTFKNKYSFQRHAFLYHEGHQRKVFPCPVCGKEFSRPDKMKNHMKTVHDCFMPKDCVVPGQREGELGWRSVQHEERPPRATTLAEERRRRQRQQRPRPPPPPPPQPRPATSREDREARSRGRR
ncbi:unnamed protein product, partial [Heterotrigona itama]